MKAAGVSPSLYMYTQLFRCRLVFETEKTHNEKNIQSFFYSTENGSTLLFCFLHAGPVDVALHDELP